MPESELTSGQIKFVQNYRPALQAGAYKIVATQTVSGADKIKENNVFHTEKEFYIRGERFHFKPLEIDSVFPPDMSQGDFQNTLPHIVFNSLTLPWERRLIMAKDPTTHYDGEGEGKLESTNGDSSAWMALLLFDENDPAPIPKKIKLRDLYPQKLPAGVWYPPDFELEYGELMDDECTVIDVPKDLFISICPSIDELKLLAHGRIVNVDHKAKEKNRQLSGNYSVIIGNRLPYKGKESMVHLVSLEGFAAAIDTPEETLKNYNYVRLISFRKWRFSCFDRPESFKKLISHLNDADTKRSETDIHKIKRLDNLLRFPLDPSQDTYKEMRSVLQSGYIPLNHQMRQGYNTVSLYRGPLVPMLIKQFISLPIENQDQLYYRDPDTNFLDVSYAAAWQLGQMLGLKNLEYSQALYKWKRNARLEDIRNWEKNQIEEKFNLVSNEAGVLMPFDEKLFKPETQKTEEKSDQEGNGNRENIKKSNPFQRHQARQIEFNPPKDPPDVVHTFLKELQELHHVPFHYLVPDPNMLPMESLKFFYLDPNWITALREGAMSIGDFLKKESGIKSSSIKVEQSDEIISGFLLRSSVLLGWPGMEIIVKGHDDAKLQYVRLERMAPDTALVIVKGKITSVTFREPGEGLHFGVNLNEEGKKPKKSWRDEKAKFTLGTADILLKEKNVIDIASLANQIPLSKKNTTADFAYQMVEGVDSVIYTYKTIG